MIMYEKRDVFVHFILRLRLSLFYIEWSMDLVHGKISSQLMPRPLASRTHPQWPPRTVCLRPRR